MYFDEKKEKAWDEYFSAYDPFCWTEENEEGIIDFVAYKYEYRLTTKTGEKKCFAKLKDIDFKKIDLGLDTTLMLIDGEGKMVDAMPSQEKYKECVYQTLRELDVHLANATTTSSYAASVVMVKIQLKEVHKMNSTALGAENIIFISEAHERFFYEKLKEVRYQDAYHKALVYCLGISEDTRRNVYNIYDFKSGCVKTECLHEGWQTSGSARVVRMAFNLYCNGMPRRKQFNQYFYK